MRYAKELPNSITCDSVKRGKSDALATAMDSGRRIHVSSFPITAGASTGHLLVPHDLAFIDKRTSEARLYTVLALVGVTLILSYWGELPSWLGSAFLQLSKFLE